MTPKKEKVIRRTGAELQRIKNAIYEAATQGDIPHTVRHIFYLLVSQGLIEKTEKAYKGTVIRLCGVMREKGELPWDRIVDGTRWQRRPTSYTSLEEAVEACKKTYRRDALAACPDYIEVWSEKNTLSGILQEVTMKYDVPLMVSVGFGSKSFLHDTAETIWEKYKRGKSSFIYQVGDHDPSGVVAYEALQRSIRRYVYKIALRELYYAALDKYGDDGSNIPQLEQDCCQSIAHCAEESVKFDRLALTELQIEHFKLPSRPTKRKGNHAKNFIGDSTEVDALDPAVLLQILEFKLQEHIPETTLNALRVAEESERESLQMFKVKEKGTTE